MIHHFLRRSSHALLLSRRKVFFSFLVPSEFWFDIFFIPMLVNNKLHLFKIFLRNFIFLTAIFLSGFFLLNGIFYFFPEIFLKFSDAYTSEINYNSLISTRWTWDIYDLKWAIFPWREADKMELLGDTTYIRWWGTKSIEYYELSLREKENSRVRQKLSILSSWSGDALTDSGSVSPLESTWSQALSWTDTPPEIESAQMRSKESEENRGKYIQKSYDNYILKDTKDFLEFWIERKDW